MTKPDTLAEFSGNPAEGLNEILRIEVRELSRSPLVLGMFAEWATYYGDAEYSLPLLRRLSLSDADGASLLSLAGRK